MISSKSILLFSLAGTLLFYACGGDSSSGVDDAQANQPGDDKSSAKLNMIIDARDGQTYKTVVLEEMIWFAQNLNYAVPNSGSVNSKCYNDDPKNCEKYGRLYSEDAAGLSNICPEGFEIVGEEEWKWLKSNYESNALKSTTDWEYWNDSLSPTNTTGLGLQPSGYGAGYDGYAALGYEGRFWDGDRGYYVFFYNKNEIVKASTNRESMPRYAVRCFSKSCSAANAKKTKALLGKYYYCDGQQWVKVNSVEDYPDNETFFNPNINYGTLTDTRDGQIYRTTTIGNQEWMAENLNYAAVGSTCYKCEVYGRKYTWAAAMGLDSIYDMVSASEYITTPHRGVCPEGWHVPTSEEFHVLDNIPQSSLMITNVVAWDFVFYAIRVNPNDIPVPTDDYGFSALPEDSFGDGAHFWTTSESKENEAETYFITSLHPEYEPSLLIPERDKTRSFFIRCLKD